MKDSKDILSSLLKTTQMGQVGIRSVVKAAEAPQFKKALRDQLDEYNKIEKETYEHDISLKGEFIRLVMASDKSPEEKEQIICCGIRALSGEEVEL